MGTTNGMPTRAIAILTLMLALTACNDDPSAPSGGTPDPWNEVDLGAASAEPVRLVAIDCGTDDCIALGIEGAAPGGTSRFWEREADGLWTTRDDVGLPAVVYTGLALDDSGSAAFVGYDMRDMSSVVYDERTPAPTTVSIERSGLVTLDGDGDFFVAGGLLGSGHLVSSVSEGVWTRDDFPSSGRNDRGFWDVDVRGDVAVACGFDDGADTLQVVLRRTRTTRWKALGRAGMPFGFDLRSIAVDDDGAIFVGGTVRPGSPAAEASAAVRSPTGEWTSLILPDPTSLGRVNDILLAGDGSIYLACSSEYEDTSIAYLLRVTESGVQNEIAPFAGELLQLAEDGGGVIYAAGSRRTDGSPSREPVLLRRSRRPGTGTVRNPL